MVGGRVNKGAIDLEYKIRSVTESEKKTRKTRQCPESRPGEVEEALMQSLRMSQRDCGTLKVRILKTKLKRRKVLVKTYRTGIRPGQILFKLKKKKLRKERLDTNHVMYGLQKDVGVQKVRLIHNPF